MQRHRDIPKASRPISIGMPEEGRKQMLRSPSSLPFAMLLMPGISCAVTFATSAIYAFRGMTAGCIEMWSNGFTTKAEEQ